MKSFRELDVWKYAMELTDVVYRLVRRFPSEERYALGDQLRRAVVSIPSNIAEGFGRDSHKDFAHFLSQAKGSLYEVDTQLEVAVRQGFLKTDDIPFELMNNVSKLIAALARRLRASPTPAQGTLPAQSTKHKAQGTPSPAQGTNSPA